MDTPSDSARPDAAPDNGGQQHASTSTDRRQDSPASSNGNNSGPLHLSRLPQEILCCFYDRLTNLFDQMAFSQTSRVLREAAAKCTLIPQARDDPSHMIRCLLNGLNPDTTVSPGRPERPKKLVCPRALRWLRALHRMARNKPNLWVCEICLALHHVHPEDLPGAPSPFDEPIISPQFELRKYGASVIGTDVRSCRRLSWSRGMNICRRTRFCDTYAYGPEHDGPRSRTSDYATLRGIYRLEHRDVQMALKYARFEAAELPMEPALQEHHRRLMSPVYFDVYPQVRREQHVQISPWFVSRLSKECFPGAEGNHITPDIGDIPLSQDFPGPSIVVRTHMQCLFWPTIATGDDGRPHYVLKSTYRIHMNGSNTSDGRPLAIYDLGPLVRPCPHHLFASQFMHTDSNPPIYTSNSPVDFLHLRYVTSGTTDPMFHGPRPAWWKERRKLWAKGARDEERDKQMKRRQRQMRHKNFWEKPPMPVMSVIGSEDRNNISASLSAAIKYASRTARFSVWQQRYSTIGANNGDTGTEPGRLHATYRVSCQFCAADFAVRFMGQCGHVLVLDSWRDFGPESEDSYGNLWWQSQLTGLQPYVQIIVQEQEQVDRHKREREGADMQLPANVGFFEAWRKTMHPPRTSIPVLGEGIPPAIILPHEPGSVRAAFEAAAGPGLEDSIPVLKACAAIWKVQEEARGCPYGDDFEYEDEDRDDGDEDVFDL